MNKKIKILSIYSWKDFFMAKNKVEITGINTSTLKTISGEEMNKQFIELQKGNKRAKNTLIEGNLKLVLSILKKYQNRCDSNRNNRSYKSNR